jgi:TPR repeat protein
LEESAVMHAPAAPSGRDKYESEARLDAYLERGQRMIDEGDLTGARSFFRRVAESGDPRGALAMGATYDANYFAELGIRGVNPDNALAGDWYRKAMDLGSKDALDRLERLTQ